MRATALLLTLLLIAAAAPADEEDASQLSTLLGSGEDQGFIKAFEARRKQEDPWLF